MLLSRLSKGLKLGARGPVGAGLQAVAAHQYISKKELDQIASEHGTTTTQRFKMYSKQAKLIYSQGWVALKKDITTYRSLQAKQKQGSETFTREELKLKKRMWGEIQGLKTLFIIQVLPMSGPLLLYYIYVYPTSIPTWFTVDSIHEKYQLDCIQTQAQAILHHQQHPLPTADFKLASLQLDQLKKLSELLFGHFEDGVTGYNKLMAPKSKPHLFHPHFSKHLVIRNIKKQFDQEIYNTPELKKLSVEELVLQKYDKIMRGQDLLQFEPILEETAQSKDEAKDPLIEPKEK